MAGQGPGLNLPFNPEGLSAIDQYKAAVKSAGQELRKLDKEMELAAKKGEAIDAQSIETYKRVEALRTSSQGKLREIAARFEQAHEAHQTERIGKSLGRVFGGQLGQKLIRGEMITGGDLVREVVASERLVQKAAKWAGLKDATISEFGAAVPVIGEAINKSIEAYHKVQEDRKVADKVARQYARGELTDQEHEVFDKAQGSGQGGWNPMKWNWSGLGSEDPEKVLERAQKSSDAFARIGVTKAQAVFDNFAANPDPQNPGWKAMDFLSTASLAGHLLSADIHSTQGVQGQSANALSNKIQNAMQAEKRRLGTAILEKETQQRVIRAVIIDEHLSTELQNRLIKAGEESSEETKRTQLSASRAFIAHEKEIMHNLAFEIRHKRIAANPVDF